MVAECWECEAATSQPIVVTIELPTGHRPRVRLCPSCYRRYYLPLIARGCLQGGARASHVGDTPGPQHKPRSALAASTDTGRKVSPTGPSGSRGRRVSRG